MSEALCQAGLKGIAILDVLTEYGAVAAEELYTKYQVPAQFYKVDVRNDAHVAECIESIREEFGQIDVLLCSAGIADSNIPAEKYDPGMFRRLIDINLTGTFLCAQAVAKEMIASGNGGSIIFIASMSGHIVNYPQEQSCYNASKAGVIMLGKSLAAEWAKYKIRVNCISPGYMDTALNRVPQLDAQKVQWKERTPMGRLGDPDELNGLALFLASDASTFVTGSDILADGGYTCW
ncbi:NAD(P)-binding protein [Ascobolus immersus RN42]|uniref:NAD(P)-binding protein n=1 Tax=Ascobolus immersus RN42 TaxID=1160509 RepID=A0A3N4HM57_ASCIM|nr:NAD(P)-binding protein [Ascobolus immersus RN42]